MTFTIPKSGFSESRTSESGIAPGSAPDCYLVAVTAARKKCGVPFVLSFRL